MTCEQGGKVAGRKTIRKKRGIITVVVASDGSVGSFFQKRGRLQRGVWKTQVSHANLRASRNLQSKF